MARATFRWTRPPSTAWKARVYVDALNDALAAILAYWSPQVEGRAKQDAPWTDRTGNARQTLAAFPAKRGAIHMLILRHKMEYGLWLEIRHGGKYAIIMPTLQQFYYPVWDSVKRLVEG